MISPKVKSRITNSASYYVNQITEGLQISNPGSIRLKIRLWHEIDPGIKELSSQWKRKKHCFPETILHVPVVKVFNLSREKSVELCILSMSLDLTKIELLVAGR